MEKVKKKDKSEGPSPQSYSIRGNQIESPKFTIRHRTKIPNYSKEDQHLPGPGGYSEYKHYLIGYGMAKSFGEKLHYNSNYNNVNVGPGKYIIENQIDERFVPNEY